GEPLDNYDEVTKFLSILSAEKGINISLRNVSLSTSGLVPKIRELADSNLPVVLTISMHAATDEKRSALMPVNKAYPIKELIDSAKYYFEKTRRRVIFEYALVEGKNSDKKSADELARLLKGFPCHVNLINLNYVKEKGLRGIKGNYIKEFIDNLNKQGISATLRHSMGNDIDGACGQLRVKYLAEHDVVNRGEDEE
ncbi:MAG: radical SAM protein, partial [Clostridia bacterium]|nr:radical SAM protein [Clostridia bacterium]